MACRSASLSHHSTHGTILHRWLPGGSLEKCTHVSHFFLLDIAVSGCSCGIVLVTGMGSCLETCEPPLHWSRVSSDWAATWTHACWWYWHRRKSPLSPHWARGSLSTRMSFHDPVCGPSLQTCLLMGFMNGLVSGTNLLSRSAPCVGASIDLDDTRMLSSECSPGILSKLRGELYSMG